MKRSAAFIISIILALCCSVFAQEGSPVYAPFPYETVPFPTQSVISGEPLKIDLEDFIIGIESEDFKSVTTARNVPVTLFQDAADPLKVAAMFKPGAKGVVIFPLIFTMKDGAVTKVDLAAEIRALHPVTFEYKPGKKIESAFVAGTFNGWNSGADPLTDPDEDGVYTAEMKLEPGEYKYKLVVDGDWIADPGNPKQESGGYGNSILEVKGEKVETPPRILPQNYKEVKSKDADRYTFYYHDETGKYPHKGTKNLLLDNTARFGLVGEAGDKLMVDVPEDHLQGKTMRLFAHSENGVWAEEGFARDTGEKFDWRDAIIYFVFIDRFKNGNPENDDPVKDERVAPRANWHGGDFAGIEEMIKDDYFEDLGVNCLWLSPVIENADGAWKESVEPHRYYSGYHGYWPVSPRKTEPRFGDLEELKSLIKTAHDHDLKVILDFVSNHVHEKHPYFKKHPDWFGTLELPDGKQNIRLFDAHPFTTWFDTFLPSFDYPANPEAQEQVIEDAMWWLKETGADGFRHDATKHIPIEFWKKICRAVRSKIEIPEKRNLYEVGETISDRETIMKFVGPSLLTGQFDYPLMWVMREAIAQKTAGMDSLGKAMMESRSAYGPMPVMSPFIDSHDVSRFISWCDGDLPDDEYDDKEVGWHKKFEVDNPESYDLLHLAMAFVMSQPGAPMIYYGDETGMPGAGDPDNRRPMRFGKELKENEKEMLKRAGELCEARNEHEALRRGDVMILDSGPDHLVFLRTTFEEKIICAFNRSDKEMKLKLKLPIILTEARKIKPILKYGDADMEKGMINITLPARGVEYLEVE